MLGFTVSVANLVGSARISSSLMLSSSRITASPAFSHSRSLAEVVPTLTVGNGWRVRMRAFSRRLRPSSQTVRVRSTRFSTWYSSVDNSRRSGKSRRCTESTAWVSGVTRNSSYTWSAMNGMNGAISSVNSSITEYSVV